MTGRDKDVYIKTSIQSYNSLCVKILNTCRIATVKRVTYSQQRCYQDCKARRSAAEYSSELLTVSCST